MCRPGYHKHSQLTQFKIVYNDFPVPRPYTRTQLSSPTTQARGSVSENVQPLVSTGPQTPSSKPPVPLFESSATSISRVADSAPASQNEEVGSQQSEELPEPLILLLNGILTTLRASFMDRPPHTVQRLAELILSPTNHYKTLPAWLRALDRVINVSSTADTFPLPDQAPLVNAVNGDTGSILLGATTTSDSNTFRNAYDSNDLGSDESLGGALLTPIPWLRNGTQDTEESGDTQPNTASTENDDLNVNGLDSATEAAATAAAAVVNNTSPDPLVPERPEGAVTQGELMRLEQEAGVIPVAAQTITTTRIPGEADQSEEMHEESADTIPHARGPDLVGAVDMGKVEGRNVEVSLGSPPSPDTKEDAERRPGESSAESILRRMGEGYAKQTPAISPGMMDEDYEMVDEMDVDEDTAAPPADAGKSTEASGKSASPEVDEDLVLVDAAEGKENAPATGQSPAEKDKEK